jgi:sugar/nucleoside kinase (ribokinase family)
MTGRVVSLGNALVDVVAAVPHLPERGSDVLASGGRVEVGGGGFRALVAARVAGAEAVFAGRIGTGPFGDRVRAALGALGVPAPLPPVTGADSGFVLTAIEPDGERTFMTVPGAESAEPGLDGFAVAARDVVHVHGYGLVAPGRGAALAAFVLGLPEEVVVLLDPGPFGAEADPEVLAHLLPRLDWWSGNAAEARAATGLGDAEAAARLLAGTVRAGAVVRRGAEGCLVAERGGAVVHLPAPEVVAIDSNGAGDTHVGAFLAGLLRGLASLEAAGAANAAAAAFVSRSSLRSPPLAR